MATTLRPDAGRVHRATNAPPLPVSVRIRALQCYRAATDRLGSTLFRFPSHALIRAGAQDSPYVGFLSFLAAGRAAGQPRHWLSARLAELDQMGAELWRDTYEADVWLEREEQRAENTCNTAELEHRIAPTNVNKLSLADALEAEAARELARAKSLRTEAEMMA